MNSRDGRFFGAPPIGRENSRVRILNGPHVLSYFRTHGAPEARMNSRGRSGRRRCLWCVLAQFPVSWPLSSLGRPPRSMDLRRRRRRLQALALSRDGGGLRRLTLAEKSVSSLPLAERSPRKRMPVAHISGLCSRVCGCLWVSRRRDLCVTDRKKSPASQQQAKFRTSSKPHDIEQRVFCTPSLPPRRHSTSSNPLATYCEHVRVVWLVQLRTQTNLFTYLLYQAKNTRSPAPKMTGNKQTF